MKPFRHRGAAAEDHGRGGRGHISLVAKGPFQLQAASLVDGQLRHGGRLESGVGRRGAPAVPVRPVKGGSPRGFRGDALYQKWYRTLWIPGLKRLPARFYRLDSQREPVREWLKKLVPENRKIVGEDIKDLEFAWPIGMPLVRALGNGLWEVRSNLTGGKIARVIFTEEQGSMVLLHGFIKKSQKTPKHDLDLALKRKKGGGA